MFSGNGFAQPTWLNGSAEEMLKAFFENEDGNGDGKVTGCQGVRICFVPPFQVDGLKF